ncbi:Calcipressin-like protein [Pseudocercospora fuligena]|uniref:Calcipressin-like protein n=1 Tax=Pseudocercospora fuligena TaxID=685502 RepID=A0A8H6VD31_9PEZI|nr:Calcipressin-like protein [Pseudocercospora fuligena]
MYQPNNADSPEQVSSQSQPSTIPATTTSNNEQQMATMAMHPSPTPSPLSSRRRHSPNLSIDLSDLPQLSKPSPPSNTLLITNLESLEIFTASNLESIRAAINQHAQIHTFSPLKSFRRIIVSFYTTEDAVNIRQVLDGETVLGHRVRVYFGKDTKINVEDQHLQAPESGKLFFISPPPSPPVGWESRNEDPPNKQVHAEDLAVALANLRAQPSADDALYEDMQGKSPISPNTNGRSRSSTLVFDPQEHGHSPDLPAIAVEDTTDSPMPISPMEGVEKKFPHTARPPVELMEQ